MLILDFASTAEAEGADAAEARVLWEQVTAATALLSSVQSHSTIPEGRGAGLVDAAWREG